MTYYVEPDYWVAGYAEGDATGTFIYGSGTSIANGEVLTAGNYRASSFRAMTMAQSSVLVAGDYIAIFPGVNLNSVSGMFVGPNITASNVAQSTTQSSTQASGRIFWEITAPVSGTWTEIVPQAEGTGE